MTAVSSSSSHCSTLPAAAGGVPFYRTPHLSSGTVVGQYGIESTCVADVCDHIEMQRTSAVTTSGSSGVDVDALLLRQHLFQLQEFERQCDVQKRNAVRQEVLQRNASQCREFCIAEANAREEIAVSEAAAFRIAVARHVTNVSHESQCKQQVQERHLQRFLNADDSRRKRDEALDKTTEDADRSAGFAALKAEREQYQAEVSKRQAAIMAKQKAAEALRAAFVFITSDEKRRRQQMHHEEDAWFQKEVVVAAEVSRKDAEARAYDRWVNSDEQKILQAEKERRIAEEKAAVIRRENEFKREQVRLVSKCTHSRSGTSVFVGPLAKKMCLICKVKFDEVQQIYIRMP